MNDLRLIKGESLAKIVLRSAEIAIELIQLRFSEPVIENDSLVSVCSTCGMNVNTNPWLHAIPFHSDCVRLL